MRARGFGSTTATPKGFGTIDPPAGGWPTLSVILLNPEGKLATSFALDQLAQQDYPLEQIKEVVVGGADAFAATAPAALQPLLRDFQGAGETLNIAGELDGCLGDVVAVWGDDHVSPPNRLSMQVASTTTSQAATVLRPSWFFDPVGDDFMHVREWPTAEFEEYMAPVPEGFAELMVASDPLTLCGSRKELVKAASNLEPSSSPTNELKELLVMLLKVKPPQFIDDVKWAAVRAPPPATRYEPATPEKALLELTRSAFPKGSAGQVKLALDAALKEIKDSKMTAPRAVGRILSETVTKAPSDREMKRVRKALSETFLMSTGADIATAVAELSTWPGIEPGKGDADAVRSFPLFYACFAAIREHVAENGDLMDMEALGPTAEGIVKLAMRMWGSDPKISDTLAQIIIPELYRGDKSKMPKDTSSGFNIVATLGLNECLTNVAYAAQVQKGQHFNVQALSSLAWALAEGNIMNTALQMKVAKALIADVDKLTPRDIGKLFIAMHEKKWFKEATTVAYLTESILAQIKELKRQDPGLAEILAAQSS